MVFFFVIPRANIRIFHVPSCSPEAIQGIPRTPKTSGVPIGIPGIGDYLLEFDFGTPLQPNMIPPLWETLISSLYEMFL